MAPHAADFLYQSLNVKTPLEFLEVLPSHYESFLMSCEEDLKDNQTIVVKGFIKSVTKEVSKSRFHIIRFQLQTKMKIYNVIIFNQPFYARLLKRDDSYLVKGLFHLKNAEIVARIILTSSSPYYNLELRPSYLHPKSIKNSTYQGAISSALKEVQGYVLNIVPTYFIEKYKLLPRELAFHYVHEPQTFKELKEGLRVFKYEEALNYAVRSALIKSDNAKIKKTDYEKIEIYKVASFINNLPFSLTASQSTAIYEMIDKMNSLESMNRILEGDVGSGKTVVGFCLLYANYLRHKVGVLMAPTEALIRQHMANILPLFSKTKARIVCLSGTTKKSEAKLIRQDLMDGKIDILLGTHALFSQSMVYPSLGLAIIDEQHKFGVNQRVILTSKGEGTDLLLMSATPIPRTLSQIMNSELELSLLTEFPFESRMVITRIVTPDDLVIEKTIRNAMKLGKPIFIVAPRIEESLRGVLKRTVKNLYEEYAETYGAENVSLIHGKVKAEERVKILSEFKKKQVPILIATSLIEVGIDISEAGLMVIYEAASFSLASLHQLRGRIGRDGNKAICFLVSSKTDEDELKKLQILVDSNDGMKIAEEDLKLRGPGTIDGLKQSGNKGGITNFVTDAHYFTQAALDADYLLTHLNDQEMASYLAKIRYELDESNNIWRLSFE